MIEFIKTNLDKILHFLVGYFVYTFTYKIIYILLTDINKIYISVSCMIIVYLLACLKEYKDIKGTGLNYYDLFVTVLGGLIGLVICKL